MKNFCFHLISDTIKNSLVIDIYRKRHSTEQKLDKPIDLDTQYVSLKLLSQDNIQTMQRDALEQPDRYQFGLENHHGEDIQDEDLVKPGDFRKSVLIRGRAGIGKTTLLQRLSWKWATDEWACKFKALFLVNLRYLMTVKKKMDLRHLLSLYTVYTVGKGFLIDACWLEKNQSKIGIIIGNVQTFLQKVIVFE